MTASGVLNNVKYFKVLIPKEIASKDNIEIIAQIFHRERR